MVHITIDGKKIEAEEGSTILDAAEKSGIHIPNLCYLKGMKGIGACRLCLVDIEGLKAPMTACTTKVKEGMSIKTTSAEIDSMRCFVIDLILSMHPMDCMTCTKAGVCRLQEYAYRYNLKESNYTRKRWGFQVDDKNPFIQRDPDYCVLCGRCVRVCKEQDTKILEFIGRGVGSKIGTANDKPMHETSCTFCGGCVDVCPVNAFTEADRALKGREWEFKKTDSVCTFCGNACAICVTSSNNSIVKVTSQGSEYAHDRYTCAYGRYGFDYLNSENRLTVPLIRKDGVLQEASWDEAVKAVSSALGSAGKGAAFITNGSILTEDSLALMSLGTDILKTKHLYTTAGLYTDKETLITQEANLGDADLFIIAGLNTSQSERIFPALDALIRRMSGAGVPLMTIGSSSLSERASAIIEDNPLEGIRSLLSYLCREGLCKDKEVLKMTKNAAISEAVEKAGALFASSKHPIVITLPSLYEAALNLTLIKGSTVAVQYESNSTGALMSGLSGTHKDIEDIISGKTIKALYAVGETTIKKRPDIPFVVVHTTHLNDLAREADVVLPLTSPYESSGTIIDMFGKMRHIEAALEPHGKAIMPREAFSAIAEALGTQIDRIKKSDIKKLLKAKKASKALRINKKEGFIEDPITIFNAVNNSLVSTGRVLWLRQKDIKRA